MKTHENNSSYWYKLVKRIKEFDRMNPETINCVSNEKKKSQTFFNNLTPEKYTHIIQYVKIFSKTHYRKILQQNEKDADKNGQLDICKTLRRKWREYKKNINLNKSQKVKNEPVYKIHSNKYADHKKKLLSEHFLLNNLIVDSGRVLWNDTRWKFTLAHPDDQWKIVTNCFRNELIGCYKGRDSVYAKLRNAYIGITKDRVGEILNGQEINQIRGDEAKTEIPNAEKIAKHPNDIWQIDITLFKANYPGNTHQTKSLLVVIDLFSRYVWTKILVRGTSKNKKEISQSVQALGVLFKQEGAPKILSADNEFSSNAIVKLCNDFGTKVLPGRPYHSTDQGHVERIHHVLKDNVAKFMYDGQLKNWESYIENVTYVYNTSVHSALNGVSPFKLYRNFDNRFSQNHLFHIEKSSETVEQEDINIIENPPHYTFTYAFPEIPEKVKEKTRTTKKTPTPVPEINIGNDGSADTFLKSEAVFPIGTQVCFIDDNNISFHAKITNINLTGYIFDSTQIGDNTTSYELSYSFKKFHTCILNALNKISETNNRPFGKSFGRDTQKCSTYSATTIGVPYQHTDDEGNTHIINNVGTYFDQNVIAQTLFYVYKSNEKKFQEWITNFSMLQKECVQRRDTSNIEKDFWTQTTTHILKKKSKKKTYLKWTNSSRTECGKAHHSIPYYDYNEENNASHNSEINNDGSWWTPGKEWKKSTIFKGKFACFIRPNSKNAIEEDHLEISFYGDKNYRSVKKIETLYSSLWSMNELLRNTTSEVYDDHNSLKKIVSFLTSLLHRREDPTTYINHMPFVDPRYKYAYKFIPNKLMDYNSSPDTKNFISFDTIMYFADNIYDWIRLIHKCQNHHWEKNKKKWYTHIIPNLQGQNPVKRKDAAQKYFDDVDKLKIEMSRHIMAAQFNIPRRWQMKGGSGDPRSGNPHSGGNGNRNPQQRNVREEANLTRYEGLINERYRKILRQEERLNNDKYKIDIGDIVRLKINYDPEQTTVNKQKYTIGFRHVKKKKSEIKSADPDRLDRYKIRARWTSSLYQVIDKGRVYDFIRGDNERIHIFLPLRFGDLREETELINPSVKLKQYLRHVLGTEHSSLTLDTNTNKLSRVRYRLVKITNEFIHAKTKNSSGSNSTSVIDKYGRLNVQNLKNKIELYRKNHKTICSGENDDKCKKSQKEIDKYLPFVYYRKHNYKNNVHQKTGMDFSTHIIQNFYWNNMSKQRSQYIQLRKKNDIENDDLIFSDDDEDKDIDRWSNLRSKN